MHNAAEEQKSTHGAWATIVWLVGAIGLFLFDDLSPSLWSLQALGFIAIGMFAAAIIVGNITYWLQNRLASALSKNIDPNHNLDEQASKIRRLGWILLLVDTFISAVFLYWVYNSFFLI